MIDIHCHILPGVDDGATDDADAVKMARIAAEDGIEKIVATPHIRDEQYPQQAIIEKTDHLNRLLEKLQIPVKILPGAEVQHLLAPSIIKAYTINNTKYVLIEFPYDYMPQNSKKIIFQLIIHGLKPIIAHPERNSAIIRNPKMLVNLLDTNVYVQITADSIAGIFGREIQKCSIYLLQNALVDLIASDAHSSDHRSPNLSGGLKWAEKIIGKEKAQQMVRKNPEAIINGDNIKRLR